MEAFPLFECLLGHLVLLGGIPVQHIRIVRESHALAEPLDDCRWVVEEIVSVDDADLDSLRGTGTVGAIAIISVARAHEVRLSQVVENAADFIVAGFGFVKIVEAGHFVERRDRASVVGWDTIVWVTDEEREVEFGKKFGRDNSWVVLFCRSIVWIRGFCASRASTLHRPALLNFFQGRISHPLFTLHQRWGSTGRLAVGRNKIVDDVLDKKTFPLCQR